MAKTTKTATDEACPHCGTTYGAFRCYTIASYSDAYHQIAWNREHSPSRRAVLSHWAHCKSVDWAYHVEHCGDVVECDDDFDASDFADDDFDFDTDTDTTETNTTEGNEMTNTNTTDTATATSTRKPRAIDFRCPKCDARPGKACAGSRIPSCNSLGGGWGGAPDRTRPHDERYAVRRAAIALDVTPADVVSTHREPAPRGDFTRHPTATDLDAAARTSAFDFVNDSYALVVQDAPADAPADDAPAVDTRTLSLFDDAVAAIAPKSESIEVPAGATIADTEADFADGWREWCRMGFVDVAACTVEVASEVGADTRPVACSKAFAAGYHAAHLDNENGGGDRPHSTDADDAARSQTYFVPTPPTPPAATRTCDNCGATVRADRWTCGAPCVPAAPVVDDEGIEAHAVVDAHGRRVESVRLADGTCATFTYGAFVEPAWIDEIRAHAHAVLSGERYAFAHGYTSIAIDGGTTFAFPRATFADDGVRVIMFALQTTGGARFVTARPRPFNLARVNAEAPVVEAPAKRAPVREFEIRDAASGSFMAGTAGLALALTIRDAQIAAGVSCFVVELLDDEGTARAVAVGSRDWRMIVGRPVRAAAEDADRGEVLDVTCPACDGEIRRGKYGVKCTCGGFSVPCHVAHYAGSIH